jgi:hypothetical protein
MRAIVLAATVIGLREDQYMKNFCEYLRLYWAYLSTGFGWAKALLGAIVWLAGMFAPLAAKTLILVNLPTWLVVPWMLAWAILGYVIAPYGLWKHYRAQTSEQGGYP